jgi:CheY-like chemotaxis protein
MDASHETVPPLAGRRVVVVDDDGELCDAFEDVLRDAGHDVVCFSNGERALRYLRVARRPDVVLLDLSMPVMDGREFIKEFQKRSELAGVPVLMITASRDQDGYPVPPERVIHKPFRVPSLLGLIDQITQEQQSRV